MLNGNLKQHMLIYTGDKPYKCKLCDGEFMTNRGLNQHMLIRAGDKPFG